MIGRIKYHLSIGLAAAASALLAGCGDKPAPVQSAPPPPAPPSWVAVEVPPRPRPPLDAAPSLTVPGVDASGLRQSVNRGLSPAQTVWNLRAAYNVAALNCAEPLRTPITAGYRTFLKKFSKGLSLANRQADAEYRAQHGAGYIARRETAMTEVYNHFALPPTLPAFCTAVNAVSHDLVAAKAAELSDAATRSLPSIEVVFDDFYRKYDQYRANAAAWDVRYGATGLTNGGEIKVPRESPLAQLR